MPAEPELLERSEILARVTAALGDAAAGRGRLLLVAGEAGIGKTSLLRAFAAQRPPGARVLWGACDRLFTPRALGPFLDIADAIGGELAAAAASDALAPHEMVAALSAELRREAPSVVVVEDVHWADEGTLDVLKLLGRRIESVPALLLVSYRDDEIGPAHPVRILLGDLAGAPGVSRQHLPPLSLEAVRVLVSRSNGFGDASRLHATTGGNPFFVTEVLAAGVEVPETVRDAVLARAARLTADERRLLESAAVMPSRAEVWLLERIAGDDVAALDGCLRSGMLHAEAGHVAFRHELARLAVEEAIAPNRRLALHRAVLAALSSDARLVDPALLAHHADAAGDAEAVLRYSPVAGERAAALHAHTEAAEHFARALRHGGALSEEVRLRLLERLAYECYLTDQMPQAIAARDEALEIHRARGDRIREGDAHRWLSRLAWFAGDNARAEREARLALEVLETEPPGPELAMALSNMAQLRMLAGEADTAIKFGERAMALAIGLDEQETYVHALNNVGTMLMQSDRASGVAMLERSLQLARHAGLGEHVARAYTNLGAGSVRAGELEYGIRRLGEGVAWCEEHGLDSWTRYMTGWVAWSRLQVGEWNAAAVAATDVLRHPNVDVPSRIMPLLVLGLLRARRGDPEVWPVLDEALSLARGTAEAQRLVPVCAARAEARWLEGADRETVIAETDEAFAVALARPDPWQLGELCRWRGSADGIDLAGAPPFALEASGDPAGAAAWWEERGCLYETALVRVLAGDVPSLRAALTTFQELGATAASRTATAALRALGAASISRGPRRSTRANPAQLTERQLDIVRLLGDRLTNAEIAARLVISPKTVDHHVSAILGKLGVRSRADAAAEAERLGILVR